MPTPTFYNLPDEKQRRILDAAVAEFARQPFSTASINRIVRDAGIPRGSFYQYFEGKEDLYLDVLSRIGQEKLAAISATPVPEDADFFDYMRHMSVSALDWAVRHPDYYRIGMLMDLDDSVFIEQLKQRNREAMDQLLAYIESDQKRGRIRKDVDAKLLLDAMYDLVLKRVSDLFRNNRNHEELLHEIDAVLDLLKKGAAHEPDPD